MKKSSPLEMLKRQIEILSLIEKEPNKYDKSDLSDLFNVEFPTINRDLQAIRKMGYKVHSIKKKLRLLNVLESDDYNKLLSQYLLSSNRVVTFPKNISLTTLKLQDKTLNIFIQLVKAIEKKTQIEIDYYKVFDDVLVRRAVNPFKLIPTMKEWLLIGDSEGSVKQFYVDNIVKIYEKKTIFSKPSSKDIRKIYYESWETYCGDESIGIKLLFSSKVAHVIKNRIWNEHQMLEIQPDGRILLSFKVSELSEMLGWIMSWGGDVVIIEPNELRTMVLKAAKGIKEANI
ncbi:MAG: WYL domain-containing protein [Ignavibacteria bacterium]|nr:WYL domain-containing protein [Ignavibacteria bacterium]